MRSTSIRTGLLIVSATSILVTGTASADSVPDLTGFHAYSGSYDRGGSPQGIGLEVEKQRGRRLRTVTIDASNEAQFQGRGRISADHLTFRVNTHTSGSRKNRHRLRLDGSVIGDGASLEGTYELARPGLETLTGTFSVSR